MLLIIVIDSRANTFEEFVVCCFLRVYGEQRRDIVTNEERLGVFSTELIFASYIVEFY